MNNLLYFEDDITPTFGITDIKYISAGYKNTYLFSENSIQHRQLIPENIILVEQYINWNAYRPWRTMANNFNSIVPIILGEIFRGNLKPGKLIVAIKRLTSNIFKANSIEQKCKEFGLDINESILYAFWFYDNIFLAFLKRKNPKAVFVSRAHGGDLYEDGLTLKGQVLMRNFQLKYMNYLFAISETGCKYLKEIYSRWTEKIKVGRLGTEDHNTLNIRPINGLSIITCAHIRNVKRLHLLVEALINADFPVKWYHVGSENLENANIDNAIKEYHAAKEKLNGNKNVEINIMGVLEPREVIEFYRTVPLSLLISTSENEGIPVSMMEAISFGVPVISTDVGGCSEIVNEKTGELMPANVTPSEILQHLKKFMTSSLNTDEFRVGVREFWMQNFNEVSNYSFISREIAKVRQN